jgi:hypothetical protein
MPSLVSGLARFLPLRRRWSRASNRELPAAGRRRPLTRVYRWPKGSQAIGRTVRWWRSSVSMECGSCGTRRRAQLVEVRPRAENEEEHLPGAVSLPLREILPRGGGGGRPGRSPRTPASRCCCPSPDSSGPTGPGHPADPLARRGADSLPGPHVLGAREPRDRRSLPPHRRPAGARGRPLGGRGFAAAPPLSCVSRPPGGNRPIVSAETRTDLSGLWALERVSGLLPPLGLLHKRIEGVRGATRLGTVLRLPFDVRDGRRGPELVYAGPLGIVRDRLEPSGDGGWSGETLVLGVPVGRFRMMPTLDRPVGVPNGDLTKRSRRR